jgi:predicted RecB family nuclease
MSPSSPRVTGGALKRLLDCERRLWLSEHAREHAAARSEHDEVLGERNRSLEDVSATAVQALTAPLLRPGVSFDEAAAETVRLLRDTLLPLRRPVLVSADGRYTATPAFILREGEALVIRDVRLAHRPEKKRENRVRAAFAGWLAEQLSGRKVVRLEIVNGLGRVVEVSAEPEAALAALAARALELMGDSPEPDLLLAHSHCQHCAHYTHCWDRAEAEHRIEVVPMVTRVRAELLHAEGVRTFDELAERTADSFADPDLRAHAPLLLAEARAFATAAPVWLRDPGLPLDRTPVWFDVESDSDGELATVPVYLWGLAVENDEPRAEAVLAELTSAGDRDAWRRFVARALEVFRRHPDAVWVHWHNAEPMWLERYIARHGAPDEFVSRVHAPGAMFDLHRALERAVRLPLRSTSIKFVAPWLGFAWSNPDADAAWSTAQLHRAYETDDPVERERLLADVARYNADDLWAMRAVWRWMEAQCSRA